MNEPCSCGDEWCRDESCTICGDPNDHYGVPHSVAYPEPILEAIRRLHGGWCSDSRPETDHEQCDWSRTATRVLTTLYPLIDADVRERAAYKLELKAAQAAPWSERRRAFVDAATITRSGI